MGRPPKPLEQIKATARNSKHKANGSPLPVPVSPSVPDRTVPAPPDDVAGRGVEEWQKVWEAGFWLHRDADYHWVEMIARAYQDMQVFRETVQAEGLTATGYAGQVVAHPLIAEIRRCESTIQKCLQVLGFSPTDRARLAITEAKAQNAVLEMLSKKS